MLDAKEVDPVAMTSTRVAFAQTNVYNISDTVKELKSDKAQV